MDLGGFFLKKTEKLILEMTEKQQGMCFALCIAHCFFTQPDPSTSPSNSKCVFVFANMFGNFIKVIQLAEGLDREK